MHYMIVGAGPSGVIACETIRKMDKNAKISLISGQCEPPYSRMAIPYFLEEKIAEKGTYLRHDENYFSDQNIGIVSQAVTQVDSSNDNVILANGEVLSYDKLLLATGATAISPPIAGIDLNNVHNCWTLEDARNIAAKAVPGSSVVLMGAGFIGCIILQSLLKRGVKLTVVEMGVRMVPRMMDDVAGALLKSWCESKGVTIMTSQQVTSINAVNEGLIVDLKDANSLNADLVICATGVKSNIDFLENSGINIDQGIVVNEFLQTNINNIYASGDVAQGLDFSDQSQHVQAIQPTAVEHGRIAAINMVNNNCCIHRGSVNMNILDTMGLISTSFGQWMGVPDGEQSILLDKDNYLYINLQFDGDYLVGVSSLGHTQNIGVVRGLIRGKVKLGVWKKRLMNNPNRLMEAYLASSLSQA
ncbi:MAG: FAD-dependent oxidoreductase [gamma proteobacterium symbiont of Taylorina sp.]|nr:FAD-dependent oxidoreductase [gamma proteobacterium symbiont of Taylorina sp.]